jgi:hypothetical protein
MQKFFFDMKDGVPMRDRVSIEFAGNAEAIEHCKELAQHIRDGSLRSTKELRKCSGLFCLLLEFGDLAITLHSSKSWPSINCLAAAIVAASSGRMPDHVDHENGWGVSSSR